MKFSKHSLTANAFYSQFLLAKRKIKQVFLFQSKSSRHYIFVSDRCAQMYWW